VSVRDRLNHKLRPWIIGMYGGFALAFASGALASLLDEPPAVALLILGFVICFTSMLVIQFGTRCPFCKLRLGQMLLASGWVWRLGPEFNFCPKCGTSLDQEVPE
jgi:hypothetical protein